MLQGINEKCMGYRNLFVYVLQNNLKYINSSAIDDRSQFWLSCLGY